MSRFWGIPLGFRRVARSTALTVVTAGDSLTAGYFEPGNLDQLSAYPAHLHRLLVEAHPNRVVNVINAGVGGDTAPLLRRRLNRDVLTHQPDVVVIAIGSNDAFRDKPGFHGTLSGIVRRVKKGGADVVLVTPGFFAKTPRFAAGKYADAAPKFNQRQGDGTVQRYAQMVRDVAAQHRVRLADVYAMWQQWEREGVDTDSLLANGLNHPVPEVHRDMAELIADQIVCGTRMHSNLLQPR